MLTKASLSTETLALVLEQSVDCVKLLSLDGALLWMNGNGLCAMEIDDFRAIEGKQWKELWPPELGETIDGCYAQAAAGDVVRFHAFCPTAKGTPRWWDVSVTLVNGTDGRPAGFLSISRDITDAERGRQAVALANKEMRHRLANTYAIVGSLIMAFARGTPDREVFARDMQKRLSTLYKAQTLFASGDAPRQVSELLPALVAPFTGQSNAVTLGPLPDTLVDMEHSDAIALVLGELTVNSIKHGALGADGTVHIHAEDEDGRLRIFWAETSEKPVKARERDGGQGLDLIRQIVEGRDGTLAIEWAEFGLTVTLSFAVSH